MSLSLSLALTPGNSILQPQGPVGYDIYVGGPDASDANDGTSWEQAFETLAAAQAAMIAHGSGVRVALYGGEKRRESLSLFGQGIDNVTIDVLEGVGLFEIDGSDVITDWTLDTGAEYTASVSHDGFGTDRPMVFEDGVLMERIEGGGALAEGQFADTKASDGDPFTIKIRATGSGDPSTNGKVYEVSRRRAGLFLPGNNIRIDGVFTRRALGNNGSVELGPSTLIKRSVFAEGTKHSAFMASGAFEDCIAVNADKTTSYALSNGLYVNFINDAAGYDARYTRCGAVGANGWPATAQLMHDGVEGDYDTFTAEQIWSAGATIGTWVPAAKTIDINAFYSTAQFPLNVWVSDTALVEYALFRQTDGRQISLRRGSDGTGKVLTVRNCVFFEGHTANVSAEMIRLSNVMDGLTIAFEHCIFYTTKFRSFFGAAGTAWAVGGISFHNCIFSYAQNGNPVVVPTGISYSGDNNVYLGNSSTNLNFSYHGALYTTIAAIRTATGHEANSIALGPADLAELFSGSSAAGNFTLGSTGAGADAQTLQAGPQTHWDWNARAVAPGPPTAWATVPATLEEAKTYVLDPEAHNFYP